MRKAASFFFVFFFAFASAVTAQDVLVMRDGNSVNGKVIEISDVSVKYQSQTADAQTITINAENIESIVFSNGTVKVFTHAQTEQSLAASPQKIAYIDKFSDHYLMGDKRMTEDEYMKFLKQHCPEAYKSHESGKKLAKAGWVCLGIGGGIGVVGSVLWGAYFNSAEGWYWGDYKRGSKEKVLAGVALTSAGTAILTVSVPLLTVGYARKNKSHVIYNNYCARQNTPVALTLKAKTDGMAVAINF